jgi:hypothetical protein
MLLEFADGPYGGLTYGNVYGLPFTANVATVFPSAISVNVPSRQPISFGPTNVFFSTTTSNLSTTDTFDLENLRSNQEEVFY